MFSIASKRTASGGGRAHLRAGGVYNNLARMYYIVRKHLNFI